MGVPDAPSVWFAGWWWTAVLARAPLAVETSAEAVIPAGVVDGGWEGPNAKPSVRTFVLVIVALTAANPARGLVGEVRR
jgi:predicted secreted protein